MTKYLKQTAKHEKVQRDESGDPLLNAYGEYDYAEPVEVKCRREPARRNTVVTTGEYIAPHDVYYVDETVDIGVQDRIDGQIVLDVYPYIGSLGELVGYEVYV